jgi:hypothetical protein
LHTAFWQENLKERDRLDDLDVDGDTNEIYFEETGWEVGLHSFYSGGPSGEYRMPYFLTT